jgi:Xaa-Pro aminopeptidase
MDTPEDVFRDRRRRALEALDRSVLVLPAAPNAFRSRDTEHRYRPDSDLFYLTGATEPETVAVLVAGDEPEFILFVRERDAEAELWAGARLGVDDAAERFRADATYPVSELGKRLPKLLQRGDRLHARLGRGDEIERLVVGALTEARARGARRGGGPRAVVDPGEVLDELRLVKDAHEIECLRAAAKITLDGHRAGAGMIRPGAGEWHVEAAVDATFRRLGASGPGFATIVGAGANGCVLHYVENEATIAEGDMVLVDAGAERSLYHGDVTRSYPANGRFSDVQRAVYEIVEAARTAAVATITPGVTIARIHEMACHVIVAGLVELGVLSGSVEELVEEGAHRPFFPHQTSHWLGLDVHDPGDYRKGGESRVLEAGMVFTVEPGLYFRPALCEGTAERYSGIGVRVEDDVLVTEEGREVLTAGLPTSAEEVEALMAGSE